ncbi:MAG: T9SS type A sorting domain-containing protein [Lewinellaceae bacterium]|nr:T9SS type A sorting domain-containing protein [Lewinellaceae bacterium]
MNYDPGTVLYYRVMVTEQSGYSYYSRVIAVKSNKSEAASLRIIPNPVKAGLPARVEIMASAPGPAILRVADLAGRQVFLKKLTLKNGVNQISLTETTGVVPAGLYFVSVSGNDKEQVARLLVQ